MQLHVRLKALLQIRSHIPLVLHKLQSLRMEPVHMVFQMTRFRIKKAWPVITFVALKNASVHQDWPFIHSHRVQLLLRFRTELTHVHVDKAKE